MWSDFGAWTAYHSPTMVMSKGGAGYDLGFDTSALWSSLTSLRFGLVRLAFRLGVVGPSNMSYGPWFEKVVGLVSPYVKGKVKI